jgi:hypothetical protein
VTRPTRIRYSIAALGAAVNLLCYTDRVVICIAGPRFQQDLSLAPVRRGLVYGILSRLRTGTNTLGHARRSLRIPFAGHRRHPLMVPLHSAFGCGLGLRRHLGIRFTFGLVSRRTRGAFPRETPAN